jgi:hypothetical protein
MEIRRLRYFIAVAELRNFTRAAEASFVAQSALSQPYVVLGLTDPLAVHRVTVVFETPCMSVSAQAFMQVLLQTANHKKKRSL